LLNRSWNEAESICRNNFQELGNTSEVELFTYLSESELFRVIDDLIREHRLDGWPRVIFSGFTAKSVSFLW